MYIFWAISFLDLTCYKPIGVGVGGRGMRSELGLECTFHETYSLFHANSYYKNKFRGTHKFIILHYLFNSSAKHTIRLFLEISRLERNDQVI